MAYSPTITRQPQGNYHLREDLGISTLYIPGMVGEILSGSASITIGDEGKQLTNPSTNTFPSSIPATPVYNATNYTWFFRIKSIDNNTGIQGLGIINPNGGGGPYPIYAYIYNSNTKLQIGINSGVITFDFILPYNVLDGQWHSIAIRINSDTGINDLFVDSTTTTVSASSSALSIQDSSNCLYKPFGYPIAGASIDGYCSLSFLSTSPLSDSTIFSICANPWSIFKRIIPYINILRIIPSSQTATVSIGSLTPVIQSPLSGLSTSISSGSVVRLVLTSLSGLSSSVLSSTLSVLCSTGIISYPLTTSVGALGYAGAIYNANITEYTDGFIENGTITKTDNFGNISTYNFYDNNVTGTISDPTQAAILEIYTGAVASYPGYFSTNDGFLDDDIYIQDSKYYQTFSYEIKVDATLDKYKSIVKTLLHPAGYELYGNYTVDNNFNVGVLFQSLLNAYNQSIADTTVASDSINSFAVNKVIDSTMPGYNDTVTTTDLPTFTFIKSPIADTVTSSDSAIISTTKVLYDAAVSSDLPTMSMTSVQSDNISSVDNISSFTINTVLSDSVTVTDIIYPNFTLNNETTTISDSGTIILNSYVQNISYWPIGYTTGKSTF